MSGRDHLDDLDDQIRDHLDREAEDHVARGMTPHQARAAARSRFGEYRASQGGSARGLGSGVRSTNSGRTLATVFVCSAASLDFMPSPSSRWRSALARRRRCSASRTACC